ncbi:unnamed protein product [Rhizophagus irregularis]|nr:unnamed protein product [Rhizophagus irregularis]
MITIRNYHNQVILKDEDRDMIKAQRNYLIKMYGMTMEDIKILGKMADRIRERWLKLQEKPKPLSRIEQFKERCMENEIQTYELSLGKIDKRIREFNEEISYKIIQCNTQLEYDEIDLDSDYEDSEDETPTESENDSNENLSDNDFEREERAMSPIPYPCYIKQQKEFLVKAYHECLYQEKSLRRPIFYYKDKIIEIRRKLEPTEEDFEKEIRLERDLRKYERKIRRDYETLMDIKEKSNKDKITREATNLIWSISYRGKPHYKLEGLIYIIWEIKQNCYNYNEEGSIYFVDNKAQLYETLQEICELQKYGYIIDDRELNHRFTEFWNWITLETTAYDLFNQVETLRIFRDILYLGEKIRVNRNKIRELQKSIKFHKKDTYYHQPWKSDYLTNAIETQLLTTNGFKGEIVIENPNLKEENDEYNIIIEILQERGIQIEKEDLMRIIFTLGYNPAQIYLKGFIETYIENEGESNDVLKTILDRWISEHQIEESHDEFSSDEDENVIKTSLNPSSSEESENSSNNTTENNSTHNTRTNTPTSGNSTRSNSPPLIMAATRNEIRENIRTVMNTLLLGIDTGVALNTAPANTINATLTNMINPIHRAAKIAELPLFYGGDQDANDWIRDFNNVYAGNGPPRRQTNRPQFQQRPPIDWSRVNCYNCGKLGHTARFCRENTRQYNVIDMKDDNQDYHYDDETGLYYYFDYDYQQYFYLDEESQNELYYQDNEYYPAERTTRSQVRNNPLVGNKTLPNRDPIIKRQPVNNDIEMTERVRRPYVRKGEGKFQIKPSRFETDAQDYDIVSDLENIKPNINFAQLVAAAPKYSMEVKKAFQRQRVPRTPNQQ